MNEPTAVNLFDRTNMPHSESSLPIWPVILLWTLALMLLDVACRRIAWDVPMVQRGVAAALAKVTPSRLRGRRSAETLSTLRRVSEGFEAQQDAAAAGLTKLTGSGKIRPPPERIIRSDGTSAIAPAPHAGSDEGRPGSTDSAPAPRAVEQVEAALDALLDRKPARPEAPAAPATPEQPASAASETTSSLLAAKRRARQRLAEGSESPADQSRP